MQTTENIQFVKEQLKIKTNELKRQEKEKSQLNDKIQNILTLNRKKITELQKDIEKKDEEIKEAQSQAWAARIAKHTGIKEGGKEGEEIPQELLYRDPALVEQIEQLKKREKGLVDRIEEEKKTNQKNIKDKNLLLKELKRLRRELENIDALNEQIAKLKSELHKRPEKSSADLERLLREKDDLINNYEKMLYGNVDPGEEGMLPSEIIMDLKMELNDLLEERKKMVADLDKLQEYVSQLEMKVALSEEKDASEKMESRMNVESRAAATAEFSSGLEGFLITYSDMITLLLAVFILMVSVSRIDAQKLFDATSSFQARKVRVDRQNYWLTLEEWNMLEWIKDQSEEHHAPYTSFVPGGRSTIPINLKTDEFFSPGSANLISGAEKKIIEALGDKYTEGLKEVLVQGHTDNVPLREGSIYATNWELSAARAAAVARVMIKELKLPPGIFAATGYGEFRPKAENKDDEARAQNRRVEIYLVKDAQVMKEKKEGGALEPGAEKPGTTGPGGTPTPPAPASPPATAG